MNNPNLSFMRCSKLAIKTGSSNSLVSYPDSPHGRGVWHLTAGFLYFVKDAHAFEIANEIELLHAHT